MVNPTETASLEKLRARFVEKADGVLESIASEHGVTLAQAIACLPDGMARSVSGEHFATVMEDISDWGKFSSSFTLTMWFWNVLANFPKAVSGMACSTSAVAAHSPATCAPPIVRPSPFSNGPSSVQFRHRSSFSIAMAVRCSRFS